MGIPDSLPIGWVVRFRCCRFRTTQPYHVFALFVHARCSSTPFSAFSLFDAPGKPPKPAACQRRWHEHRVSVAACRSAGRLVEAVAVCRSRRLVEMSLGVEVPAACRNGGLSVAAASTDGKLHLISAVSTVPAPRRHDEFPVSMIHPTLGDSLRSSSFTAHPSTLRRLRRAWGRCGMKASLNERRRAAAFWFALRDGVVLSPVPGRGGRKGRLPAHTFSCRLDLLRTMQDVG